MSTFLPLAIRIDGKKILFVGGGELAMHKLQAVLQFTDDITVLDTLCSSEVSAAGVRVLNKTYEPSAPGRPQHCGPLERNGKRARR